MDMIATMNRRIFAFAPAAALVLSLGLAVPALAAKIPLNEISRYLNSLTTVTAEFTQNPDGTISTGTVYIRRPGRVRFEYNNDKTLVVASGGNVTIVDPKSNGGPQSYPLSKTPLSIILARNVDLGRANMVTGYTEAKNSTVVTAQTRRIRNTAISRWSLPARPSCASGSSPTMPARRPR